MIQQEMHGQPRTTGQDEALVKRAPGALASWASASVWTLEQPQHAMLMEMVCHRTVTDPISRSMVKWRNLFR